MQNITKFMKHNILFALAAILLTFFSFSRMLKPGMYSTQDFHIFRLVEFDKCVQSMQLPCRWAPDAGLGYGEPLFNFYGQFVYAVGEIYHLLGGSLIDSVKFLFILSLAGSGLVMFVLSKRIWKNEFSALVSSVLYVYAPYRAVDVWVRGALPEAFSFVLFPIIVLFLDRYIEKRKMSDILIFSLSLATLIISHNLSVVIFAPFLVVWSVFRISSNKSEKSLLSIIAASIFSVLLSAFYIIPLLTEAKFINLQSTIVGYFDFHNHFATSWELFVSNFWGYGASVWGPNDGLSLAVGYLQWIIPALTFAIILIRRQVFKNKEFLLLFLVGWFYIFLTHNKSTFVWESLPFMAYIQFPWRFLGLAVFCFSLASGYLIQIFTGWKIVLTFIITALVIWLNAPFFREDIWYSVTDSYYTTGAEWIRQRTASIGDFWPNLGHKIPDAPSDGKYINYFPGWKSSTDPVSGLIPSNGAVFTDTLSRKVGNIVSLISVIVFSGLIVFKFKWKKEV